MKLPTDVLLVCWRESAGARLEWAYAEKIGKEIVMAEQGWIEEYLERVETVPVLNKAKETPSLLQRGGSVRKIEDKMSFLSFLLS